MGDIWQSVHTGIVYGRHMLISDLDLGPIPKISHYANSPDPKMSKIQSAPGPELQVRS